MNRVYLSNKFGVKFNFTQSPDTFKVIENSKIKPDKKGEYRLIEASKEEISTMEMVEYLSSVFKIKESEIGYAGLKDKHAVTKQFITLPRYVNLKKFNNSSRVTLKEVGYCRDRLRVGNLVSNSFEIVLDCVSKDEFPKLQSAFLNIAKVGFANFFGYQRFGSLDDSYLKGKKISEHGKGSKNQNSKILLAAYQAKSFNKWLNRRLELSRNIMQNKQDSIISSFSPALRDEIKKQKSIYKLLPGDLGYFFKKGKKSFEVANNIKKYTDSFMLKKYRPTGVLFGSSVRLSVSVAGKIEREYIDYSFDALRGARRDSWVYPQNCKIVYNEKKHKATLNFTLPPGSYATVLLEELLQRELK
jgi:tRNA pseudouridine13 synthase